MNRVRATKNRISINLRKLWIQSDERKVRIVYTRSEDAWDYLHHSERFVTTFATFTTSFEPSLDVLMMKYFPRNELPSRTNNRHLPSQRSQNPRNSSMRFLTWKHFYNSSTTMIIIAFFTDFDFYTHFMSSLLRVYDEIEQKNFIL